jgi:hypothetical protein
MDYHVLAWPFVTDFGHPAVAFDCEGATCIWRCWVARGICRDGQALPLHPRIEDPQDEVKDATIAQCALWTSLGHREVR